MMSVLAAYVVTVAVFLIMPGPLDLVIMNGANRYGFKGALLSVAATNAASLVWIGCAGLMLAGIGGISETLLTALTGVGGLYLAYYGIRLWQDARRPRVNVQHAAEQLPPPQSLGKMARSAFWVGLASPKDILFFMTFLPPFIGRLDMGLLPGLLALTAVWCLLDYLILTAYGMGLAKLLTPKRERIAYACSGLLFVVLGLYAAAAGIRALTV
ncbi:LysE family translocator [Neisseria shayeganii]|uniref:LysE family translocator n=1 Tax=Neisseria shayeganii 871 TaxID=1032488 RepID=G4CGC8_9NEIS|nr:LysE family translocator [Neisseria shayeganii]EGY53176.1 hypothetical protein HMPREF9371_0667 [Neisseria shayeganii 871]